MSLIRVNVRKPDLKEKGPIFAYILIHGWFSYLHSHVWCSTKVISTYSFSDSDGLIFSSWGTKASSDDQYTKLQLAAATDQHTGVGHLLMFTLVVLLLSVIQPRHMQKTFFPFNLTCTFWFLQTTSCSLWDHVARCSLSHTCIVTLVVWVGWHSRFSSPQQPAHRTSGTQDGL